MGLSFTKNNFFIPKLTDFFFKKEAKLFEITSPCSQYPYMHIVILILLLLFIIYQHSNASQYDVLLTY